MLAHSHPLPKTSDLVPAASKHTSARRAIIPRGFHGTTILGSCWRQGKQGNVNSQKQQQQKKKKWKKKKKQRMVFPTRSRQFFPFVNTRSSCWVVSRRGRCGEWANCFVLCCRAMEFECRYIWDATDHVWAEVYSADLKRWVHCDPCENRWDKPMLYEAGWGKKLSYIFAFSTDEVADVIWKYSVKSTEVMTRRKLCSEAVLAHLIYQLNLQIQGSLPQERRKCLMERSADEIVGLLCRHLPELSEEERMGRQTGSEAWRRARGELGEQPETPADGSNGAVEASANPWMEL
eukprot:m.275346 g.275346  ORF g.275346 m.275346 type:complete len:291 (-) comp19353_c0_seq5:40-912(-)